MKMQMGRTKWKNWPPALEQDLQNVLCSLSILTLADVLAVPGQLGTGQFGPGQLGPEQFGGMEKPDCLRLLAAFPTKRETDHRNAYAADGLSRAFSVNDPPQWTPLQRRWIATTQTFPFGLLLREHIARLNRRLRFDEHPAVPYLIDAIAWDAWTSIEFRTAVAKLIYQHLRQRVLLFPEPRLNPALSVPFWWLIIAASVEKEATAEKDWRTRLLSRQLHAHAEERTSVPEWAGFWELYLLKLCAQTGLPLPVRVQNWPIVSTPDDPSSLTKKAGGRTVWRDRAIRDWTAEKPGFADGLLAGGI